MMTIIILSFMGNDCIPMECWNSFRNFSLEVENTLLQVSDADLIQHLVVSKDIQRRQDDLSLQVKELKAGMTVLESLW